MFKVVQFLTIDSIFNVTLLFLAQSELLELSSSIFLSCSVRNMQHQTPNNPSWGALRGDTLLLFATNFLSHNVKLLSVFVHIIEQREPEIREKVLMLPLLWETLNFIQCTENSDWDVSQEARNY